MAATAGGAGFGRGRGGGGTGKFKVPAVVVPAAPTFAITAAAPAGSSPAAVGAVQTPEDLQKVVRRQLAELTRSVDQLEKQLSKVVKSGKAPSSGKKRKPSAKAKAEREKVDAARNKRQLDLFKHCSGILRQLSNHKLAHPFTEHVDAEELGLHDYHDIITHPMDFSTIRTRLEKQSYYEPAGFAADVRLVFSNAKTYNEPDDAVYDMANTLSALFEAKWKAFTDTKLAQEIARQKEEDALLDVLGHSLNAAEVACTKELEDLSRSLNEADQHLEDIKQDCLVKCGPLRPADKKQLSSDLAKLTGPDLESAGRIVADGMGASASGTHRPRIDLEALDAVTQRRLQKHVQRCLRIKSLPSRAQELMANPPPLKKLRVATHVSKDSKHHIKIEPLDEYLDHVDLESELAALGEFSPRNFMLDGTA